MFLKDFKNELLNDKGYYRKQKKILSDIKYRVGRMIFEARVLRGITQKQLGEKIKTSQSVIASIENGNRNMSLDYLEKISKAFGTRLIPPQFEFMSKTENEYNREVFNSGHVSTVVVKTADSTEDVETKSWSRFDFNLPKITNKEEVQVPLY
ncbi:MAG: helix-turn-helix transcriptional regulator [Patescibacteria group bacterium]|jgi:transcriptional regulator with XRE-family HTH domain|nr:helix-turn-helix transcriptional regulator [Patescibacteria group bacterium]